LFWPLCWIPLVCDVFKQTGSLLHELWNQGSRSGTLPWLLWKTRMNHNKQWHNFYNGALGQGDDFLILLSPFKPSWQVWGVCRMVGCITWCGNTNHTITIYIKAL
jgi:hypothetical protein